MRRRWWWWVLGIVVVVGIGVAVWMLKPVNGPARDLTLTANVEHGRYLIRLGGCIACHTNPKAGTPEMAGGVPIATTFGTFVPPNITSDPNGGIGNWTIEQFSKAMSDGEGPQGHLYPTFPYDSYTLMSDQEIVDLWAAMKEVPPVAEPSPPHQINFPFNIRLAMAGWKNLFFHPQRYQPDPNHSERWNRGRYIANGPGHCVTCHSPRNIFGGIDGGTEFGGNAGGGAGGAAPPITKASLERMGYDPAMLSDLLLTGWGATVFLDQKPDSLMYEFIHNASEHWTQEDRDAVAYYLLGQE